MTVRQVGGLNLRALAQSARWAFIPTVEAGVSDSNLHREMRALCDRRYPLPQRSHLPAGIMDSDSIGAVEGRRIQRSLDADLYVSRGTA